MIMDARLFLNGHEVHSVVYRYDHFDKQWIIDATVDQSALTESAYADIPTLQQVISKWKESSEP